METPLKPRGVFLTFLKIDDEFSLRKKEVQKD